MSMIGWIQVLLCAGLAVSGNLMMMAGLDRAGGFACKLSTLYQSFTLLAQQPLFVLGVIIYFVASVLWLRVISVEPLSLAYPVLISVAFILVNVGSIIFFGENFSYYKLLGMVVILIGILVLSRG